MIKPNQFFSRKPRFTNSKGECLTLEEIRDKRIASVTIVYLAEERRREQVGILGKLGFFSDVQDKKEVVITDCRIYLCFLGFETATIFFSSQEKFEKIQGFDKDSLWKQPIDPASELFQVTCPKTSLKQIDWS